MQSSKYHPGYVFFLLAFVVLNTFAIKAASAGTPPKIQLAIILDTSNSMDGLINQTRNQLWQVVNEFSTAKQDGQVPELEIALFEFGNDNNAKDKGHVRMLNAFTRELDAVSEGLFSLTTDGGHEFSGFAIKTAVQDLQWSQSDSDIKTIFIAGNERFDQGPVSYQEAISDALRQGISVSTIHAGSRQTGIDDGWQDGALLAGGDYLSIDADQQVVHVVAPQDKKIAVLNSELNKTYLPYGSNGGEKLQRQQEQDEQSIGISIGLLAKRAASKISGFYSNSKWDLVDALKDGEVNEESIMQLEPEALPEPMKELSSGERMAFVKQKAEAREKIRQEISELSRQRADFVAEQKQQQAAAAPSISDALSATVKKQAREKNFSFE